MHKHQPQPTQQNSKAAAHVTPTNRDGETVHLKVGEKDDVFQRQTDQVLQRVISPNAIQKKHNPSQVREQETIQLKENLEQPNKEIKDTKIQTKLYVSQPGDPHEQEADKMADKVMSMGELESNPMNFTRLGDQISRKEQSGETPLKAPSENVMRRIEGVTNKEVMPTPQGKSKETIQPKEEKVQNTELKDLKTVQEAGNEVPPKTRIALENGKGSGHPLPVKTRKFMERRFQVDFSKVRIHNDGLSAELNKSLHAKAFTFRNHIYFNTGQFQPDSKEGQYLLAHELTHIIQQSGGRVNISRQAGNIIQAKNAPGSAASKSGGGSGSGGAQKGSSNTPATGAGKSPGTPPAQAGAPGSPPAQGGAGSKKGTDGVIMPEPPNKLSDTEQKRLETVKNNASKVADKQGALPNADTNVSGARAAVNEPKTETDARAGKDVVTALKQKAPPSPEIKKLCEDIRKAIRDKRPPDENSLVKADPTAAATQAGNQIDGSIKNNADKAQGNYDQLSETPTGAAQQKGQPIDAPPQSVNTAPPGAQTAVPSGVPAQNVSLNADVASGEKQIQDAGMNTDPAKLVKSGPIADARGAQGELAQTAKEDPAKVMAEQQAALTKANTDMLALQQSAMAALAGSRAGGVTGVTKRQGKMVETEEQTRTRVGKEATTIFESAQKKVTDLLKPLPESGMNKWEAGVKISSEKFKNRLKKVEDWIKERHSGGWGAVVEFVDDITGLPAWVTQEYNAAEKEFGDEACALIEEISSDVNTVIASCERIIEDARKQIDKLFSDLPANLKDWAKGEQARFSEQLNQLQGQVTKTRDDFNKDLAERASTAVQEVREQVHALREKAKGMIGRLKDALDRFLADPAKFILEGLLELVGIPPASFWALIAKIKKVIKDIAANPMGFANNLMKAIGQGFQQFFDNFGKHLLQGFLDWLLSGMKSVGVTIPKDLSLKSVITFFLQLMGITWARIRKLLVKHIGEKNVGLIEKAFSVVAKLIELGPKGLFDLLESYLDPNKIMKTVIDAGIKFLIEALIKQVTARIILLFNPVGAIAQAVEAIYRVLKWVFQNAARIFTLIETIVNGIADLIAGNFAAMANAVEKGLAKLIPPVIGFLADYIGLGDLPNKIADVVRGLQEWVEGMLDKVIEWMVVQGKKLLAAVGLGGKDKKGKTKDGEVGKKITFTAGKESHKVWLDVQGTNVEVMVASNTEKAEAKLVSWLARISEIPEDKQAEAKKLISDAQQKLSSTKKEGKQAAEIKQKDEQSSTKEGETTEESKFNAENEQVKEAEQNFADIMQQLFVLFDEDPDLTIIFAQQLDRVDPNAIHIITEHLKKDVKELKKLKKWTDIESKLKEKSNVKSIVDKPLLSSHIFGQRASEDQAIPAITKALSANNVQEEYIGDIKKYLIYRKQFINEGVYPFGGANTGLQKQVFEKENRETVNSQLIEAFTNKIKGDKFARLNREDIRKELEKTVESSGKDWMAVFATGGKKLTYIKEGEEYPLRLVDIWRSQQMPRDSIVSIFVEPIEKTIIADKEFVKKHLKDKTPKLYAIGLSNKIVTKMEQMELYYVKNTDIPRSLSPGPHLIVNNDKSIQLAKYKKIAAEAEEKAVSKLSGETHHIIPLYLGGGSEASNLISVLEGVAHKMMHDFINELNISKIVGTKNTTTLDWSSLSNAFPDDMLKIIIGTVLDGEARGSIQYKETNLLYKMEKDEKGA